MKLEFSQQEQLSIQYLVQCLIKADGLVLPEENVCWNTISLKMKWEESAPEVLETVDFQALFHFSQVFDIQITGPSKADKPPVAVTLFILFPQPWRIFRKSLRGAGRYAIILAVSGRDDFGRTRHSTVI